VRILIVKLGSIGDIVHTLPALGAIRRRHRTAAIGWVVERHSAEILRENPWIDHLIEVDTRSLRKRASVDELLRDLRGQVGELRKNNFDIALDFQGLLKSSLIAKLSGAKKRWGFARQALRERTSRVFLTSTVKIPEGTHIIRKNLLLAHAALDAADTPNLFDFPLQTGSMDALEAAELTADAGGKFAVLNPGGGWPTKLWPAENYGALADRLWSELGITSLLVTGPRETALADRVTGASKSGHLVATKPSLKGLFELTSHAAVYVGGDTGPTHIAMAAGAPIVGIFGPTEWWRNGSIDPNDICIERNDIGCRVDCHRRSCSNWICMDISVDRVFEAVRERMTRPSGTLISDLKNGN
jgi:lipopolysaccharide heptosyltransferase I